MSPDLVGYGGAWPDPTWPNGAKLAELDRRRDRLWLARRVDIAQAFDAACPA